MTSAKAPVYKTTPGKPGFYGLRSLKMAFDIPAIGLTCNQWTYRKERKVFLFIFCAFHALCGLTYS